MRKTGFTIAPEAGTQRMRDVINKNITEQDVMNSCSVAFRGRLVGDEDVLHDRAADRNGRGRDAASPSLAERSASLAGTSSTRSSR